MKIAVIQVTYNDDYKIADWISHYNEYKDEIYLHIIVDNGSEPSYISKIVELFTKSVFIFRKSNGGCTAAYNDGLRLALSDSKVDSIMLLANDMRIPQNGITLLYDELMRNENSLVGVIQPIILRKDSDEVENFGCLINKDLFMNHLDSGKKYSDVKDKVRIVESVPGGANLAKRSFYEEIGLQDEKLFMYSDEVDMAFRAKELNVKYLATSNVIAWHQHRNISESNDRLYYTYYLMSRNKIYLANKFFTKRRLILIFFLHLLRNFRVLVVNILLFRKIDNSIYSILGVYHGLRKNYMGKPKFID